ncbi:MAG: alpha/beta fold hydrolase [Spirochaetales bacterium]|nr:alpha/beta fold hydrolase [Spirochaetales bacterium]
MILQYKEYGLPKDPTVFFLHGLLGSSSNWNTLCKKLSRGGLHCIAVDLRNHGLSPHRDKMTYPLMAEDVTALADSLGIEVFSLVGHSLGGKVAMEIALEAPNRVDKLLVIDIAPVAYEWALPDYITALKKVDVSKVEKRSNVEFQLKQYLQDEVVVSFLLTNLRKTSDGDFYWRVNLDSIIENFTNVGEALQAARVFDGAVLFIKGSDSDFIKNSYLMSMKELFPSYKVSVVEGSGHWVSYEKPEEFTRLVTDFLL